MLQRLWQRISGSRPAATPARPGSIAERERYEGVELQARPIREGNLWRVAGTIQRGSGGDAETHDFVRADTMSDHDQAVKMSLLKARQLVDDLGETLFRRRSG